MVSWANFSCHVAEELRVATTKLEFAGSNLSPIDHTWFGDSFTESLIGKGLTLPDRTLGGLSISCSISPHFTDPDQVPHVWGTCSEWFVVKEIKRKGKKK